MTSSRRDFLAMMATALGAGIVMTGCGGGGGSAGSGGGSFSSSGGASPNGFRFTELVNSAGFSLPTQNRSVKMRAKAAVKASPRASSTFQAFTGAIELTNGQHIFFHAIDDQGIVALYEGRLDFSGPSPRIVDIHRVMGQGDTLPDGTTIAGIGQGQANAQGTYVTVITQQDSAPAIYVGSSGTGFQPLALMGGTAPGGGAMLGGDFGNVGIDDSGNVAYVASYVPNGTTQGLHGLAYVIANDPNHPGSGILFSTQDVIPDGLGTTGGVGLFALSGAGQYVAQTTVNGGAANEGGGTTGGGAAPTVSLTALEITPSAGIVAEGVVGQLLVSARYSDGTGGDVTPGAVWSSDTPTVATVTAGIVLGVAQGSTTITATFGGLSARVVVRVEPRSVLTAQPAGNVCALEMSTLTQTFTNLRLASPQGVCVDLDGWIYIADTGSNRVLRLKDLNDTSPVVLLGDATPFSSPRGIALDTSGRLYVADHGNSRVIRFDDITGANPVSLPPPPWALSGFFPADVFVAASGRIYVVDDGIDAGGNPGVLPGKVFSVDDVDGRNLAFYPPEPTREVMGARGVWVDAGGRIYVAAAGVHALVRMDDLAGTNIVTCTLQVAQGPNDVVVDTDDRIYFSTDADLQRMDDMVGTNLMQLSSGAESAQIVVLPQASSRLLPLPVRKDVVVPRGVVGLPDSVVVAGTIGQPRSRRVVAAARSTALHPVLRSTREVAQGTAIYGPRVTSGGIVVSVLHLDETNLALYYGTSLVAQTGGRSPHGNTIASFTPPVCGGEDRIYYVLICEETAELVMYDGTQARTILARGDKVGERIINGLNFGLSQHQADLNDRLVLIAEYNDGTSGIVVGTPV